MKKFTKEDVLKLANEMSRERYKEVGLIHTGTNPLAISSDVDCVLEALTEQINQKLEEIDQRFKELEMLHPNKFPWIY